MKEIHLPSRVSVVVVTYNQQEYIEECLDSILGQDYPNLEIIVSDDASTDNTQHILIEYQKRYPDLFKLSLSEHNLGIIKNCNKALALCTGDYICMIGGDDVLLPDKVKLQAQYLDNNPKCTLCYHNAEVFFADEPDEEDYLYHARVAPCTSVEELVYQIPFPLCPVSTAIRRSALPRNGYDERLPAVSDRLFFLQVALQGSIHYIDQVLIRYRKRKEGASRSIALKDRFLVLFVIERLYPRYWRACAKGYGVIYHRRAQHLFQQKLYRYALIYALRSLIRGVLYRENITLITKVFGAALKRKICCW